MDERAESWLQLLLEDAEPTAYEALRQRRLAAATQEAERERIAAEALRAERLRSRLRERQQRARELAALGDLALRLTGTHQRGALLQESVAQARRLLDVDVAYLALTGSDGKMTIEVTDGSTGPRLRGIVLEPSSGLAGRVVERGEPVQSTDYLDDAGLHHAPGVDDVARAERLRTILGAPLRLRGETLGVLMVAQRRVRSFTGQETSLLSSLAAYAAVAIDNARLIERLRDHVTTVDRAVALHEDLLRAALRGGGVDEAVTGLSRVVAGTVRFEDEAGRTVATARNGSAAVPDDGADRCTRTVPVSSSAARFGTLRVSTSTPLDEDSPRLLERAAMTIALVVAAERAATDAERRSAAELLEALVVGEVEDTSAFERRARTRGLDVARGHTVAVADLHDAPALARLAARHGGLSGVVRGRAVGILDISPEELRDQLTGVTAGLGGPAHGVAGLAAAYRDAAACLSVLHALDRADVRAAPADLGPYRYLLSASGRADAQRFVHATIGPLLDHDARHRTDLTGTADAFLTQGRGHTATAAALTIHPNTLYQRLERIAERLGDTWRHGDRALDIHLALRLHRLARTLGEPPT
ncbi:GAF domain-containing protein [Streptomyces tubbatahanensis]|uniref:GAF domain-containing protein n=1 Tax=Streptomyces tubbatahanensis TaxID=2923272 RepID=A0ABY3XM90_9ACTN|nr:GAF domain-containing protein [Streptomyces tubbatahanensis]UNS95510.1 GAF domain-containing protein [Streptomyces tubbatahanensis]